MDLLQSFQNSWLETYTKDVPNWGFFHLAPPSMILFAVAVLVLGFLFLRQNLKHLAYFNVALAFLVISSFQACATMGPPAGDGNPIGQGVPDPNAKDLRKYFNDRTYIFSAKNKDGGSSHPDFEQYAVMLGIGDCDPSSSTSPCKYLEEWKLDDDPNSINDVWSALKSCQDGQCFQPNSVKRLVLDLKLDIQNLTERPVIAAEHGRPFSVFAYFIEMGTSPKVYILNPEFLNYEIVQNAQNTGSFIERYEGMPGWFVGNFVGLDEDTDEISTKNDSIRLTRIQQGIDLRIPNAQELPAVDVAVWPESYFALMPEYKTSPVLTDNRQALLRDATYHGPVNVTGELFLEGQDLEFSSPYSARDLDVTRTYRSFNGSVDAFGRAWSASFLMRRDYYALNTPTGPLGTFEFLRTGDGRLVFLPGTDNRPGPFFPLDDSSTPEDESAANPDPRATRFLQTFDANGSSNGRRNIQFDLNGRLISQIAQRSQNRLYHFYSGGLKMISNQLIRFNSQEKFLAVQRNFALAELKFKANDYAGCSAAARANLGVFEDPVFGRFIYFFKNNKGMISGLVDQAGNIIRYTYDKDKIIQVDRIAFQNPKNESAPSISSPTMMFQYTYADTPEDSDETWSALLQTVSSPDRKNFIEVIEWAPHPSLFGEAPVVNEMKLGPLNLEFKYRFSFLNPNALSSTEVKDSLDRVYEYKWDWRGYVKESWGPTESSNRELLLTRVYDPKNLRTVNIISQNIEAVWEYENQTSSQRGLLRSHSICADRENGGDTSPVFAQLATLSPNSEIEGLGCDGSYSRRTEYFPEMNGFRQADFFNDWSGTLIPTRMKLPTSSQNSVERIFEIQMTCDQPGISLTRNLATNATSGAGCAYFPFDASASWKGQYPKISRTETFADGSFRSSTSPTAPNLTTDPGLTAIDDARIPNGTVNPFGSFTQKFADGFTRVYSPSGNQDLSATEHVTFDIYGNLVQSVGAWDLSGVREVHKYFYDYRKAGARLSGLQQQNRRPINVASTSFQNAASLIGVGGGVRGSIHEGVVAENGKKASAFQQEVLQAYMPRSTWHVDNRYSDDRSTPGMSTLSNGTRVIREFYPDSNLPKEERLQMRTRIDSNDTLANLKQTWVYDEFERLVESVAVDGLKTTSIYRDDFDRGVSVVVVDSSSQGGGVVSTRVSARDWFGRPTEIMTTYEFENSNADTQEIESIEYDQFGEVFRRTKTGTPSGVESIVEFTREPETGILLATKSRSSGAGIDDREVEVTYDSFDRDLVPRHSIAKNNGVAVSEKIITPSSVFGKVEEEIVRGPTILGGSALDKTYSRTKRYFDGCGNLVKQEDSVDGSANRVTEFVIEYGLGRCLPSKIIEPNGWTKEFGYFTDKSVAVTSEMNNPQYVPGQAGRSFTSSFMECSTVATGPYKDRCSGPGLTYNFEARIDPEFLGGPSGSGSASQVLKGAVASWNSPLGQTVQVKNYIDHRPPQIDQTIITALNVTKGNGFGSSYERVVNYDQETRKQTRGAAVVGFSKVDLDPGFGMAKRTIQSRLQPYGPEPKVESSKIVSEIDSKGRVQSLKAYSGICDSGSVDSCEVSESEGNLRSDMAINTWQMGVATRATSTLNFAGDAHVTETRINELVPNTSVIRRSELIRTYNIRNASYTAGSSLVIGSDGNAQPISTDYVFSPATAKDLLSFGSQRLVQKDLLGRMTSFELSLRDISGDSSTQQYQVGDQNSDGIGDFVNRSRISNSDKLNIDLTYRDDGFTMSYGGLTAQYNLLRGDDSHSGRIGSIQVTDPSGQIWHYFPFNQVNFPGTSVRDPYIGNVDTRVGKVLEGGEWYDPQSGENLSGFSLSNTFLPYFRFRTLMPDLSFESTQMNLANGLLDSFRSYFSDGFVRVRNTSDRISKSREEHFESPNSAFSCDAVSPDAINQADRWSNSTNDAERVVFDDRGQLNFISRRFPGDPSIEISTENRFDSNARLARSTEILRVQHSSDGYFGGTEDSGKKKILRYLDKAYYYASAPAANFPDREILLKMNVQDRNSRSLATSNRVREISQQSSFEGTWLFVNAAIGPVMAFHQSSNGQWTGYDFIYDRNGNVIMMREKRRGSVSISEYREVYLPFLSSVISRYGPVVAQVENQQLNGYLTEIEDGLERLSLPRHSSDPREMPAPSLIGALGSPRDMLGIFYMGNAAYDAFSGSLVALNPESDDKVCMGGSRMIQQAQAIFDQRTIRRDSQQRIAPSVEQQALAVQAFEQSERNLVNSWWGRNTKYSTYGAISAVANWASNKLVGTDVLASIPGESLYLMWVNQKVGTQWFYEDAVGPGIAGYTGFADQVSFFIPVLGSARNVEEQFAEGTPLSQGLSIAGLAIDLASFGISSRISMLKTGSKYWNYADNAATGLGFGSDGAMMYFEP